MSFWKHLTAHRGLQQTLYTHFHSFCLKQLPSPAPPVSFNHHTPKMFPSKGSGMLDSTTIASAKTFPSSWLDLTKLSAIPDTCLLDRGKNLKNFTFYYLQTTDKEARQSVGIKMLWNIFIFFTTNILKIKMDILQTLHHLLSRSARTSPAFPMSPRLQPTQIGHLGSILVLYRYETTGDTTPHRIVTGRAVSQTSVPTALPHQYKMC